LVLAAVEAVVLILVLVLAMDLVLSEVVGLAVSALVSTFAVFDICLIVVVGKLSVSVSGSAVFFDRVVVLKVKEISNNFKMVKSGLR